MKQKQFFFALVAMLSFVFSGFAQTTVSSEDELRAALTSSTGGEITLAEDVTLKENIETGNGNYTLNLNNHQIKGDFSGYVLKVGGTLTIKGDGEITGKTTILYCKSGGTINIEGGAIHNNSNNNVIFTVGTLNVYGGSILSTASPNRAIEVAGSGKINLYGGTVTSLVVAKGALNIAGINVTVENGINVGKNAGNVNISAGTIKGDVTIADEAKSKVTISGGSFDDTEAIKDCMADGSALLQKPDGTYEIVAGQFKVGGNYYPTFAAALNAVEDGQTIELLENATGDEKSTELTFDKDIKFTITGKAPQYALPVVTFQNAEVTIKDAEILIPELDARQNAVINIVNSTVHDAGGNSIAKSYYNGTIKIDKTSTVYMMQITTMGYINVAGTVNATWQTNVYGNGIISLAEGATFNTAALHLTGQDYSGRDNTDTDRVGKPATIVVDGATLNVGSVKSDNGSDYSYNSSKGINVGTVDGKSALLDVKNGGAVNFYMANGQTTNFGAGATVNVAASTLKTISRDENGKVTLANNGTVVVTGNSQLDVKNYSGNAIQLNNGNLVDTYFAGRVDAFGTNNISGTTTIGGILSLGYGTNPTEQVVVNITGNFNGGNVLVYTNNGVDNILNVGKADSERTTVHFGQLGAFADVNVANADVTYGYAFIRNDFNATNSKFEIKGGVNTYFSGNAKVVLDNTTWNLSGYANIGSYGGYMYGNADVTLKNGSSMTATNLGVERDGEKVVKLTLEDNSSLTATKLTNQGSIVLASAEATLNSNECDNVTTSVPNQVVSYIDGKYTLVAAIAQIGGTAYTSIDEAFAKATEGQTITLVNDATPALTSQRAITKAAVIDLDGKTLTLKEDDLYFGTTTFKNGTIVVDPSVKASTAVFWMFANQTLTFDNVKIVATGVTGTYLIGLEGENSHLNLLNGSEIIIDNTENTDFIVIAHNGNGNIEVNNSKIDIKNVGRGFLKGNITISGTSEVNLKDISKAGFRIEANQTLAIKDESKVTIEGALRDGGINLVGTKASYTKAETATVNATVTETGFEAKIGDVKYTTFNEAVAAAQDGAEVTIHKAGKYNVPSGKNLTITGAVDDVVFANIGAHNMGGASMTFNNVTFEYGNENYKGLQHAGNLVYNNCTFNGQVFLYGQSETFNNCTFNQTSADAYNVWTYGAKVVAFNECTFNSAGKSVLIYHENAAMFNKVAVTKSTFKASQPVEGKAAIEMDASLTAGINLTIDDATTATGFAAGNVSGNALWNNKKGNADDANNDITVVVAGETVLAPVYEAKIGEKGYRNLQAAIDAVKNGETITMLLDVTANVTLTEKVDLHYTIDGDGNQFKGSISVNSLSDTNDNRRITIKNIKFVDDTAAEVDFITSVNTNHYPRLTIEGCTFTGSGNDGDVAVRLKSSHSVVIKDCTGRGLHSFLQNTSGWNLTIEGVTVTDSKGAFALGTVQGVTVKGSTIDVATYGIRLDADTYNNNAKIEGNKVTAFIPVVVRKVNAESNVTFTGENKFAAKNTDGKWMVIGTTEYEENGKLPAEVATGNVVVALNNTNLTYDGIHGAGLAGKGTAEAPYLINNVAELELFRNSVNAGSTRYNAPGLWVALNANINLENAEWTVGIGDGHNYSFDGNFDGKNHTIKNLNIKPYADADNYICGGLFGYTYGAVTIKNLVIENATVNFATPETDKTYHNVGVLVGFANNKDDKLNVDNVIVKGDIKVDAPQTFGVGAIVGYSYREMGAITNTKVLANAGSYIKGERFVGGITGYSYNNATIDNCTVENLTLTGEIGVGGIAGLAKNGNKITQCTVNNVTVNGDKNVAYIVGELQGEGGDVTVADNNAPQPWVGGSWNSGESFVATIGTQYYTSIAKAIEAAKETDVISLITDITATKSIAIPAAKKVTIDLNGKTITATDNETKSYGLININPGAELTINDATGNGAIKLTATNNREWNAYSSVISNQRGKLTVNGGAIEHLGGTDMAYAIDNLTNGKGTYAETIINGGTIKSTYRAVRQFLNGTEAQNILTVNGGTIEGTNKSIWMQEANANANNGALTVAAAAAIKGDVYLSANASAKEWPVTVAVAAAALQGESKVLTSNVPAGYELANVNGTYGVYTGVAKIGTAYYETLKAAVAAAQAGETITLIDNVEATEVILLGKSLTIDGNGHKVTSNATRVFRVTTSNTEVTLNDVNMVSRTVMTYPNDIRGISIDPSLSLVKLTLNNSSVDFTDASACDWAYAVNVSGNGTGHVVTVNGGTYEGANVINVHGANNTVTVKNATLTSLYPNNGQYYGACIWVLQNQGSSVEATGNTFNGGNAIAFNLGNGNTLTESDNIDNTKYVVAMIGDAYYTSIQDAVEAAQNGETIKLTQNVTIDELVKLEKAITLDLNDKKVTSTAMKAFEVYANATIKNGTIEAVQRCVDTRKAVELTLTDVTLIADKYTSYGNPQPLTIGGYENGTKVTMTNVNISAADGYGIITFVKTELTATNSTIDGYSALYVKPGSDNSVFNFTKSALSGSNAGNDVEGNSFSTIAVRANNVTVNVDVASTVTAEGNYCDAMSFGGNYAGEESVTDANVTIAGTINGNIMFAGLALNNNVISVKAEYADELATAGFVTSEADATGLVTIKDVTVLNEMTIEHSAYAGLEFVNENEKEVGTLNYVRNFSNTNWRALYVPFAINYDDIKDNFEVRRLEMAHEIEKTDGSVEIKFDFMTIKDGQTLKANYPYLIKPKQDGKYTITVKNTTLKKTVSRSIDCSTVDHKFIFTGIYETVSGQEMVKNKYYAMNANQLQYATDPDKHALNPFNWYMKIEGREDLSDVKFVFGGDFEDEETTGITNIDNDQKNDGNIYDLQGRRVLHPQKGSLYIVNGKKVVY